MKIEEIDFEVIKACIFSSKNKSEVINKLGLNPKNIRNHRFIARFIETNKLDPPFSEFRLKKINEQAKSATSIKDLCKRIGFIDKNGNVSSRFYNPVNLYIKEHNIDVSHFRRLERNGLIRYTDEEVFCLNTKASNQTVKERFLKLTQYCCVTKGCYITNWLGRPIVLELDHINGNNKDNRLENLRLLCPNCHSQTETYGNSN
jgi:hypothetical protein